MNFKQLTRRVNSEEEEVRFFQEYHVLPTEMTCANGHQMTLSFGVKIRWRCRKSTCCHVDKGIRVSNWLGGGGSKLPLETAAHTQAVERMWRSVNFRNKKQSGTTRDFMESYLVEYMWRSRLNGRDPFTVILQDIAEFWPV